MTDCYRLNVTVLVVQSERNPAVVVGLIYSTVVYTNIDQTLVN